MYIQSYKSKGNRYYRIRESGNKEFHVHLGTAAQVLKMKMQWDATHNAEEIEGEISATELSDNAHYPKVISKVGAVAQREQLEYKGEVGANPPPQNPKL